MLSDVKVSGSDDWLLKLLGDQLGAGFGRLHKLDSYRNGTFAVPEGGDAAAREAYKRFAARARLTFADTIVVQTASRIQPRGFRTAVEDDQNGDAAASRIIRENHLQVQFRDLETAKATYGQAFGVVGVDDDGSPFGVVRSPWSVAVRMDAVRPWLCEAAVIASFDEVEQRDVLTLLRPGYVRVAVCPVKDGVSSIPRDGTSWQLDPEKWEWLGVGEKLAFTDRVPVVPFSNPDGLGEFEAHTDSIDRVTTSILQRLIITAMQALKQRAIMPDKDEPLPLVYPDNHPTMAGQKIDYNELWKASPAAIWNLPPGAKIWESSGIDLQSFILAEKTDLEHLAAVTATPLYSLTPNVNQSAEGAKLSREAIQAKVRDRQLRDSAAFAEFMGLLFEAYGEIERAARAEIETIWEPQEVVVRADRAEAARAARQAGKSSRFIDEHIFELTPDEMVQEDLNRREEAFESSVLVGGGLVAGSLGGVSGGGVGDGARSTESVDY